MKRAKLKFLIKRLLREQNALSPLSEPRKPQIEEPPIDPPIDYIDSIDDKNTDDGSTEPPSPLIGCMDEGAINFNSNAVIPCDECCQYEGLTTYEFGCMNPNDINYNPNAQQDTDPTSCAGIAKEKNKEGKVGCMDDGNKSYSKYPGYAACNYDPEATQMCSANNPPNTTNISCCHYEKCTGCMLSSAQNYDPTATIPCTDDMGQNYNHCCGDRKYVHDPIPINPPIPGCTNSWAINYNEEATEDDGSCEYGGLSIDSDGDTMTAEGMLGQVQMLFAYGPCGPYNPNISTPPSGMPGIQGISNIDGPPYCGGPVCTCIVDDLEESIIPESVWGVMDNVCQVIQNMSMGEDIIDLPGQMLDYNLNELPGIGSWLQSVDELTDYSGEYDFSTQFEIATSFENYIESALGFGVACEGGQWNGIYNEDNTWDEVLITTDWFNPAALPGQIAETITWLTCQIDIAMCNGNLNPFNQLPQNGPGGCGTSGCACCKHPFWGLCNGTYTLEDIANEYGFPIELLSDLPAGVSTDVSQICEDFTAGLGEDFWDWWHSYQTGGSWLGTIDNIIPTGNLPCGWGSSYSVQQSGYCPAGLTCMACGSMAGMEEAFPSCQQTGFACVNMG